MDTTLEEESSEQLALFSVGIDVAKLRLLGESLHVAPHAAPVTVKGYAQDWGQFERWCVECGRTAFPASADTVWLYTTFLIGTQGRKFSTARRHLSAILAHHRDAGVPIPDPRRTKELIRAVKRERSERYEGKQALTPRDMHRIVQACDPSTNKGVMDRALLVLGFATSMRRSELAALMLNDISFHPQGMAVYLAHAKNDQGGEGRFIAVWPGEHAETDPIALVRAWIARRGPWNGPLFLRVDRRDTLVRAALDGHAVNSRLKTALIKAGIDPRNYAAHSLRAGAVTAAAQLGRTDQEIMALSGHKSPQVMRTYVRRARIFDGRNPLAGAL